MINSDLEPSIISISLEIEPNFYKIIYKDNGPGIEEKDKVFQLFKTLGKEKSTGIGFSTVNGMLGRLGGS
jgi:signal transduction histidine kinase